MDADSIRTALDQLGRFVADSKTRLEVLIKESSAASKADVEAVRAFIRKPWCVLPKGAAEFLLVVPKWADVQAGWLQSSTESYNVYVVDRYSQWFGAIPEAMRAELALPEPISFAAREMESWYSKLRQRLSDLCDG